MTRRRGARARNPYRDAALQIGAHFGGVLVAQLTVLLQRFVDDALQLRRYVGIQPHGRDGARFAKSRQKSPPGVCRGTAACPVAIS